MMPSIIEKRRRIKSIIDNAKYKERIKVTHEFAKLLEKQKRDFLKIISDERKIRDTEIKSLENQYQQKIKNDIKSVIENKEREVFKLKNEIVQLKKDIKDNQRAYMMYREYLDYLRRFADDLSIGSRRLIMDFTNSYKMIEGARDRVECHERYIKKIDPEIRKLLGIDEKKFIDFREIDVASVKVK